MVCLECEGSGLRVDGSLCDCKAAKAFTVTLPISLNVPVQYQGVRFDSDMLPADKCSTEYKMFMSHLLKECTTGLDRFYKNYLICSKPNTGKTVFAYTVYGSLFAKNIQIPDLMDIMEVRSILTKLYDQDTELIDLISTAKIMFIKIPLDIPSRLGETMSMIIERRVRHNCSTIFLYSGSREDIEALDTYGKVRSLYGNGSFNSIDVRSWR